MTGTVGTDMEFGLGALALGDATAHGLLLSCTLQLSPPIPPSGTRQADQESQLRTFGLTASLPNETEEGSVVLLRPIAFIALPQQTCMHPVLGLMSSRSAHAGCVGMTASHSLLPQPPGPGAAPRQTSTPRSQRHPVSTHREPLQFPPSGSSLQSQLPNILPLTRRLKRNIWALSLCSPLPLCGQETLPAPSAAAWMLPRGTGAHLKPLSPAGHQVKAIVDPKLDPEAGPVWAEGRICRPGKRPADPVCFHRPFTTAEQLEESQTMKEYRKNSINQVKRHRHKAGKTFAFYCLFRQA